MPYKDLEKRRKCRNDYEKRNRIKRRKSRHDIYFRKKLRHQLIRLLRLHAAARYFQEAISNGDHK